MTSPEETSTGPVIRDLRRIDPATGQVRDPGHGGTTAAGAAQRGPGKPRPGRHAASQPGGTSAAGGQAAAQGREAPGPSAGEPEEGPGRGPAEEPGRGPGEAGAPATGAGPGKPGTTGAGPAGPGTAEQASVTDELAERTADLQRVTAEYANYRKRVERDRIAVREQALANVLHSLLPVLDDIGRAREHGELVGGFKSVADSLESAASKLGLTTFGEEGEPFDPNVHEALMHAYSADVTEPSCVRILQPGYRVGDRILRPARVAVAEPGEPGDGGTGAGETGAAEAGAAETAGGPGEGQETRANDD